MKTMPINKQKQTNEWNAWNDEWNEEKEGKEGKPEVVKLNTKDIGFTTVSTECLQYYSSTKTEIKQNFQKKRKIREKINYRIY